PVPSLSINDVRVTEGQSGTKLVDFTVSLSAASGQTVRVDYATADHTATFASGDYVRTPNASLTFAPGVTSQRATMVINGDTAIEPDEDFFVNLSGASNATIADA